MVVQGNDMTEIVHWCSALRCLPNRTLASTTSASSVWISQFRTYASLSTPQVVYNDVYSEYRVLRYPQFDAQVTRVAGTNGGVLRNTTFSSQHPRDAKPIPLLLLIAVFGASTLHRGYSPLTIFPPHAPSPPSMTTWHTSQWQSLGR